MITPLVLLAAIAAPLSYAEDLPKPFTLTLLQKDGKNDLKFTNSDEKAQTVSYKQTDSDTIECTARVTGDPKTEKLDYNLDTRRFDNPGEANLSAIHIRCPLPMTPAILFNGSTVEQPVLQADTDLERPLNVIFQISDLKSVNWTFGKLDDPSMSDQRKKYQEIMGKNSANAFGNVWLMTNSNATLSDEQKKFDEWSGEWTGEVGRMAFFKPTENGPRDFTWTPVRENDGEKATRLCHVKIKSDPHAETIYVNLDKVNPKENKPEVTLDSLDTKNGESSDKADKGGDAGAVEVKCDDTVEDRGSFQDSETVNLTATGGVPAKRTAKPE